MACEGCADKVAGLLRAVPGVSEVRILPSRRGAVVRIAREGGDPGALVRAVDASGHYRARVRRA